MAWLHLSVWFEWLLIWIWFVVLKLNWRLLQWLCGPKSQSFGNNSCKPQSILTKFECTGQGATTFRNFWVRSAQWGKIGARMSPPQLVFLSPIFDTILSTIWWPIFNRFGRNTWMFLHQWIYPLKLHRDACGHERRQNVDVVFRDRRSRQFSSLT